MHKKLSEKWENKPCNHLEIERLYDFGCHDGYVCSQCREEHFNKEDFKKVVNYKI